MGPWCIWHVHELIASPKAFQVCASVLLFHHSGCGGTVAALICVLGPSSTAARSHAWPPAHQSYFECTLADAFIAVVEEGTMKDFLPELARAATPAGTRLPLLPRAVLVLPANASAPYSPASPNPLREYSSNTTDAWNPRGSDLLGLTLPCAVFLVPGTLAGELRSKAQRNLELVRSRCRIVLSGLGPS
jgi:hypothetical protein